MVSGAGLDWGGAKVIDAHSHLFHRSRPDWKEADRAVIDACDKLGIEQVCCSILPLERPMRHENIRVCNDWLAEEMARFKGRVLGYCTINPGYGKPALEEMKRSMDRGFIGIKLYNDYKCTEPVVFPIIELAIEMKIPVLHHAGHTTWLPSPQPRISDGADFAELGKRYPEAMIICAHICGGGDWEWELKALKNAPTIYLDTSGSVIDEGVLEKAAQTIGADRLLFACDMSMTASVGRMRGADISEADRKKIAGANMQKILARRGGSR